MKLLAKYTLTLVASVFLSLQFLHAESLKEGNDYILLDKPLNVPKNSIIEVFNVGCPHCANIQKVLPKLFALLPDDVHFIPYHIITGAPFSMQASQVLAVSLILDKAQNLSPKDPKSHFNRSLESYFEANFYRPKRFNNAQAFIAHGLKAAGISQETFDTTLKDSNTQALLKMWQTIAQETKIQGVPSFIINGKYLLLTQGLKGEEDFIYKINYLLGED